MKAYIIRIMQVFLLYSVVLLTTACNYLDVSDELSQNLTLQQVFEKPDYVKRWHAGLFDCVSTYSWTWDNGNAFTGIWSSMCGETLISIGSCKDYMRNGFNASNAPCHRWQKLYQQIRDAQIFIENVHPLGNDKDAKYISADEAKRMIAEAKFLIAYSYFSLFEMYGPVPIMSELRNPSDKNLDAPRFPINVFLERVDEMICEVIDSGDLPETLIKSEGTGNNRYRLDEVFRPTKTVALALRAKLWVYAASDLFNGKYEETLSLKNTDGTPLFAAYDRKRWEKAKTCLEDLFKDAESKGHKLYYADDRDSHKSIYELFQNYNDEILWASGYNRYNIGKEEKNTQPRDLWNGSANCGVTQQSVDAFFDKNGLAIDDPNSCYTDEGFTEWVRNPCSSTDRRDHHIYNMYVNREPRFYAGVIYEGKSWFIQPKWNYNYQCGFAKGEGSDNSSGDHPRAGYLLGKFKNRQIAYEGDHMQSWARPGIIYRLADFYLYYAEVLNELDSSDPKIIKYLDLVRERAGIKGYTELKESGLKDIVGNYELQKKAIIQERQVELFAEGQRYFDVRRWMICGENEPADQSVIWGMNLNGSADVAPKSPESFFIRTIIEKRAWRRAMYLYPIPDAEIQKSKMLVQNPLW